MKLWCTDHTAKNLSSLQSPISEKIKKYHKKWAFLKKMVIFGGFSWFIQKWDFAELSRELRFLRCNQCINFFQSKLGKHKLYNSQSVYMADTFQTTMWYAWQVSGVIDRFLKSLEQRGINQTDLCETPQCSSLLVFLKKETTFQRNFCQIFMSAECNYISSFINYTRTKPTYSLNHSVVTLLCAVYLNVLQ